MKDQFVPYELAVKLKELGFDEDCFGFYETLKKVGDGYCLNNYAMWGGISQSISESDNYHLYITANELYGYYDNILRAPLWQQAFDWFTSKGYHSYIEGAYPWFRYYINTDDDRYEGFKHLKLEEARQACLEKLIEIIS